MKNLKHLSLIALLVLFCQDLFAKTDKYRCIWRDDPATTMTIGWNQISGSNPVVYYDLYDHGNRSSSYSYAQNPSHSVESKGMNNYFARLTGLQPGTTYYFVIKDNDSVSRRFFFTTAPDHPYERISIISGGDSRNNRKSRKNANLLVSKLRPHCVLFAGDMTGGDNATQWPQWFDDWQLTISNDGRMTPIIPARGNHEYSNQTLIDLFDSPTRNIQYALTIGGNLLRVYTLNSMMAAGGDQAAWLESDLLLHPDMTWKFAQYHHPIRPHTTRKRDKNAQMAWAKLFYEYGVDMVIECDAHDVKTTWPIRPSTDPGSDAGFIRDDVNGTTYVGEGCWGAPLRPNDDDKAWTRNSGSFNQFKWIFVDQNGVEVRTIKTDNAYSVGEVDPYYVFAEPSNLDVWNPSNGSVVYLNNNQTLASIQPTTPPAPIYTPPPAVYTPPQPTYTPPVVKTEPAPVIKSEPTYIPPPPPPKEKVEEVITSTPVVTKPEPEPTPPPVKEVPVYKPPVYTPPPPVTKPVEKPVERPVLPPSRPAPTPAPIAKKVNEVSNFTTRIENDIVHFMLAAKNESQNLLFELQRSTNGTFFKTIKTRESAAPSGETQNYSFKDKTAMFIDAPKVYYRMKYGTSSSSTQYSAVRSVSLTPWKDYYELELNTEANLLRIHYALQSKGNVELFIYNKRGQEEIRQKFLDQKPGDYTRLVDLRGLASDTYLLHLRSGSEAIVRRVVIP